MRFVEIITESFDKPYPVTVQQTGDGYGASVKLDDGSELKIEFGMEDVGYDDEMSEYSVEFYRNGSQKITGQGDSIRVFATVLNAMAQFIKMADPYMLVFNATKEVEAGQNANSRSKLYTRLVNKYASKWGYRVYTEDHGDVMVYELIKNLEEGNKAQLGIPANATDAELRKARKAGGKKGQRAHWLLNMRKGNKNK